MVVLHIPLSARKNPPQDLSNPVNPGNAEEEQGSVPISVRKLMRNTSRDPVEYSQVSDRKTLKMQNPGDRKTGRIFKLDWCQETGAGSEHKGAS